MENTPDVSALLKILKENSRQLILDTLMDGRFHTVSELANSAKIERHTASYHLKIMQNLNLLTEEKQGRFKYYQLKNNEIANLFEFLTAYSPTTPINYLSKKRKQEQLYYARTCYDHLAGYIGVQINQFLMNNDFIKYNEESIYLTDQGENFFVDVLDISNFNEIKKEKRCFCRLCLDWSERKHHLAGSIGKALLDSLIQKKVLLLDNHSRALFVSDFGKQFLTDHFDIEFG